MITEFINENRSILIWLTSLSTLTFFGTILLIPVILIRMSAEYFVTPERTPIFERQHPLMRFTLLLLKNILGLIFIIAGFVMLFIPGQGLLTIFIGITLINFPGKRKLEQRLILHPKVLPIINSIRQKAGKTPLIIDNKHILRKDEN